MASAPAPTLAPSPGGPVSNARFKHSFDSEATGARVRAVSSRRPPSSRPRSALGSPASSKDAGTKQRLLEAATQTFAERGYEHATVRDVCRLARANVAAVNYHFGTKERLYVEAIRAATRLCHDARDLVAMQGVAADPAVSREERLDRVVRGFAETMLAPRGGVHIRLMLSELSSPTHALEVIVREFVAPRAAVLRSVVAPFRPGAGERELTLLVMSIVGQILYHRVSGAVALRLLGEREYGPDLLATVVEHIVGFTRAALAAGSPPRGRKGRA